MTPQKSCESFVLYTYHFVTYGLMSPFARFHPLHCGDTALPIEHLTDLDRLCATASSGKMFMSLTRVSPSLRERLVQSGTCDGYRQVRNGLFRHSYKVLLSEIIPNLCPPILQLLCAQHTCNIWRCPVRWLHPFAIFTDVATRAELSKVCFIYLPQQLFIINPKGN